MPSGIRSKPMLPQGADGTIDTSFSGGRNSAIFRYKGAPKTEPQNALSVSTLPLIETNVHVCST